MAIIYSYPRRIPLASDIMLAAEISAPGEDPPVVKSFTVGQLIELIEGGGGIYAPLDSPQFTGTPYLPIGTTGVTRAISNNSTSLATTAFVQSVIAAITPGQQDLQQVTTKGNVTTTAIEANSFVKTGATGTNILLDDGNTLAVSTIPTVTPSALTKVDDTNVTLTLGGSPSTALLQGVSLTLGWTGTLADSRITSAVTWNAKENVLTFSSPLSRSVNTVSMPPASTSVDGYLTSTNWNTFNNKENSLGNPSQNGYVLSSTTTGTRSWVANGTPGAVTSVGATSPITSSAGTSPVISTSMATNRLIGRSTTGTGVMEQITVGSGLTLSAGTLTNTATPTPLGYYGAFQDLLTQTITTINVGQPFLIRTVDESNQVSITANGSGQLTRITPANAGTYNIQWSGQFQNPNNAIHDVNVWFRKGLTSSSGPGTDIPGSNGKIALPARKSASAGEEGHIVAGWNFVLTITAGEYVEFYWMSDNALITLQAYTGALPPPSTASLIVTVTQQSGIMAGTGVTGTGTTNYISKFTGTTAIGNSQIFDDGTNIGIGTTLPTAKLEVLSTNFPVTKITRSTVLTSALRSTFAAKHLTSGDMLDGFGPDISFIIQDNSNVENEIANFGAVRDGLDNNGALIFSTRQSGVRYDRMKLFSDGRLALATDFAGVTSSPQYKLYVNGSQYLQNINQQLFLDDFNRTSVSPGGNPTIAYTLGTTGGSTATISSTQLRIPNNANTSLGYTYVTGSMPISYNGDVVYNTILEKNIGLLTWSFNFRTGRSVVLEGFASGQFGLATILCTNSTDPQAVGAKGYAVYYINNQVFLVYFDDGLTAYSTVTTISPLGLTQDYYSARVTYDCGTAKWNLEVRNDGASAFSNPNSGIYTLQSGFVTFPILLTPISMPYFGWLWNFNATTTVQSAFFDNFGFNILTGGSLIVDGNIGIGTTLPNLSAKLDITSTTQGFLPPRMTTTQINAIATPAIGLVVYNTTLNVLCYRDDVGWKKVTNTVM